MATGLPQIIIVGGGFGGLAAAKALRRTPARVTLIDRTNHHVFQPLLYQVATSVLTPAQIASPIRESLRKRSNATVILGEVNGVDVERRCVIAKSMDREGVRLDYDYLILATGVDGLGIRSPAISFAGKSAGERLSAMGVDVSDGKARLAADRESLPIAIAGRRPGHRNSGDGRRRNSGFVKKNNRPIAETGHMIAPWKQP